MKRFQALKALALKHKYVSVAVAAVVLLGAWMLVSGGARETVVHVAKAGEFVQEVSASGKVVAASDVAMAFEHTGRVARLHVQVGDVVRAGQPLVSLEVGTLAADLASAQADVALRRIEAQNESINLEEITHQQNELVESAYRTLLSEGLVAVPGGAYSVEAPTVTGAYQEGAEGSYRVKVERRPGGSVGYQLRTFGIETTEPIDVLEGEPTPLGTHGLFMTFTDDLEEYNETRWEIAVPNKKSSEYLANYNAYQEAVRERATTIAAAEAELRQQSDGLTVSKANLARAEASLARIRTEIAERTLFAPFAGTVTAVDVDPGDAVSLEKPVVSVISVNDLEIESFVPEINISNLSVGDPAVVTLDAYGETAPFAARVAAIDPAETVRDGVSTYRVQLAFNERDERVRSGMTSNIVITTDERSDVLMVPQGAVSVKGGKRYVSVLQDGKGVEREVATGAVSSVGEIEILSGLTAGESILIQAQ